MNWASHAIEELQVGRLVVITPHGNSMMPVVKSGQKVTLHPLRSVDPQVDQIVLVKVRGRVYLHWVKAERDGRYLIGNNHGHLNGWVGRNAVYGFMER